MNPTLADKLTADAYQRMSRARTQLVLDYPFFGSLSLRLDLVADNTCQTAYTNGRIIGFSPAFVMSLSTAEVLGLLAHEVLHCTNGHCWRRDNRDPKRWNIACDYAINGQLIESGFTLPAGALINPQYSDRFAEWIYDRLPQD